MNKEKIEEAAQKYIHSEYHGTIAHEWDVLYDKADIKAKAKKKYFEAGALWAIQEYKKSLWHDASEEPEQLSLCIVYGVFPYKDREQIEDYFISYFTPYGWTNDYFPRNHTYTIKRWACLDDILPEIGGKR